MDRKNKTTQNAPNDGSRKRSPLCERIKSLRCRKKDNDAARYKASGSAVAPVQGLPANGVGENIDDPAANEHPAVIAPNAPQPGKDKEVEFDSTGNMSGSAAAIEPEQKGPTNDVGDNIVDPAAHPSPIVADTPQPGKGKEVAFDGTENTSASAPEVQNLPKKDTSGASRSETVEPLGTAAADAEVSNESASIRGAIDSYNASLKRLHEINSKLREKLKLPPELQDEAPLEELTHKNGNNILDDAIQTVQRLTNSVAANRQATTAPQKGLLPNTERFLKATAYNLAPALKVFLTVGVTGSAVGPKVYQVDISIDSDSQPLWTVVQWPKSSHKCMIPYRLWLTDRN
jgi:hypothetical protein